jgi:hypothetical protein
MASGVLTGRVRNGSQNNESSTIATAGTDFALSDEISIEVSIDNPATTVTFTARNSSGTVIGTSRTLTYYAPSEPCDAALVVIANSAASALNMVSVDRLDLGIQGRDLAR